MFCLMLNIWIKCHLFGRPSRSEWNDWKYPSGISSPPANTAAEWPPQAVQQHACPSTLHTSTDGSHLQEHKNATVIHMNTPTYCFTLHAHTFSETMWWFGYGCDDFKTGIEFHGQLCCSVSLTCSLILLSLCSTWFLSALYQCRVKEMSQGHCCFFHRKKKLYHKHFGWDV